MLAVNPRLTAAQIGGILRRTARPLPGADFTWRDDAGAGEIDEARCLDEAAPGRPAPRPHVKLTVFQAGKGDCLLLTGRGGANVLVDGGMRERLSRPRGAGARPARARGASGSTLVYVSHIDQDHIAGVLQLLDDVVAWRVFDFQRSRGNTRFAEPERPRPPAIANVWHNGFRDQVRDNAGEIEDLLAARAAVLAASEDPGLQGAGAGPPRAGDQHPRGPRAVGAPGPRAARDPAEQAVPGPPRAGPGRGAAGPPGRHDVLGHRPVPPRPRGAPARLERVAAGAARRGGEPPAPDGARRRAARGRRRRLAERAAGAGRRRAGQPLARHRPQPRLADAAREGGPSHDAPHRRRARDRHPQGAREDAGSSTATGASTSTSSRSSTTAPSTTPTPRSWSA